MFLRGAQPHTQLKPGIFRCLPNGNRIQSCFKQCRYRPGKLQTLEHAGTNTGCSHRNANGCHSHSEGYKLPKTLLFPLLRYPKTRKQTWTARDLLQNNWGFQEPSAADRHGSAPGARQQEGSSAWREVCCCCRSTNLPRLCHWATPACTNWGSFQIVFLLLFETTVNQLGGAAQEWPMRENQIRVTCTQARELSDILLAHAVTALWARRRKCCQKMFFPQISILQTFRRKMCCSSDGSEQCLPSDLWNWPLGQCQFTTNSGATSYHLCQPMETKAGQDRGQTPSSWLADVSEAAVTPTLPHLDHEELPPSGSTEHKCQSSGHSTDLSDV